jgi:hypothetical protein
MSFFFANNSNYIFSANYFAVTANFFYRRANFHITLQTNNHLKQVFIEAIRRRLVNLPFSIRTHIEKT